MKRQRQEETTIDLVDETSDGPEPVATRPARALVRDVATCMHADLVGVACMLSVRTLLAWHQTCYAYWRQWCDPAYLGTLLERAHSLATLKRQRDMRVARHLADCLTLDTQLLAFRIGEVLWLKAAPRWLDTSDLTIVPQQRFHLTDITIRMLLAVLKQHRIDQCKDAVLPTRLLQAFRRGCAYLAVRYDWCIISLCRSEEKGSGVARRTVTTDVPLTGADIRFDDTMVLRIAPHLHS